MRGIIKEKGFYVNVWVFFFEVRACRNSCNGFKNISNKIRVYTMGYEGKVKKKRSTQDRHRERQDRNCWLD